MITTAEFSKFRDLLKAYNNNKQTTNNLKEGQLNSNTFSSDSDSNGFGVSQASSISSHQLYSPNYGFPKNAKATAIIFKSTSAINKENDNGSPNQDISNQYLTQQHQISKLTSSKHQSQSSNNRLVKQPLSLATTTDRKIYSGPRFNAQYELTNSKLKDDYRTNDRDFYYSEYDLAPAAPKNEMRKLGEKTSNNLDNDGLEDDENDYNYSRKNQNKYKKSNHLLGREFGLEDYENNNRQSTKQNRGDYKSMNRNLKLYTANKNKKSDYLDNYHETDDLEEDDEFFSKSKNLSKKNQDKSKISSRQLLSDPLKKNSDRDLKNSEDDEEIFFNQDDNDEDIAYREKYHQTNKHPNPIKLNSKQSMSRSISHNRPLQSKSFAINKSNRKLIKENDEEDSNSYYNPNPDTHQQVNDNYLNKNQLNSQQQTPRSILVKTSSFSFEIPNHSEHEEVEFDDHIGKNNKIRPTYTLDQTARKTSALASSLSTSPGLIYHRTTTKHNKDEKYNSLDQPLQSNPSLKDYDINTPTAKYANNLNINNLDDNSLGMNGKNNRDEHSMPFLKKTERQQQQYATSIEHKKGRVAIVTSNSKLNSNDDDLFNQFEIKRQPNFIQNHNHHLPHSHLEDVEAYYSKVKDKKPTKFRQYFHQQELKHTGNAGKNRFNNVKPNILESLDNRYNQMQKQNSSIRDEDTPIKNMQNDYEPKENSSKDKNIRDKSPIVSSPVQTKQPRIYFNWHSNINHNKQQQSQSATKAKPQEIEPSLNNNHNNNDNDFNIFNVKDEENEPVLMNKSNRSPNKLNNNHHNEMKTNQKNQRMNTNSPPEHHHQPPPPQPPQMPKHQNYKPMPNPLDDDWFKEPELKLPNPPEQLPSKKTQQPQQSQKPIKNDNHLDNNDIESNSGDIEYDDDPLPKPQVPNQNYPNEANKQANNQSKPKNTKPLNNFKQKPAHHQPPSKKEFQPNIKTPIKLQVMDQKNKQYKPTTTLSPPNDKHDDEDFVKQPKSTPQQTTASQPPQPTQSQANQASSKNSISPAYRTKYLKSSEFAEKQKISKNAFKNSFKPAHQPVTTAATISITSPNSASNKETDRKADYQKAKLLNLQYKNDKENKKPDNLKPFSRMPSRNFGDKSNDKNDKNAPEKTEKPNADKNEKANSNAGKKIIINSNLQNSSTTINAQVLEKLPISVDSIFDNIDDDNFDYEGDNNSANNKKSDLSANDNSEINNGNYNGNYRRKESENVNSNENQSNENSLNDDQLITNTGNLTANDETHEYGTRIRGNNGRLQPKVSIKASYSSVSSTVPRAMAQKMDKQKVDVVGFRSLESDDLILKKENNLLKNRMKQFKKANWLSPLTNKLTTIATETNNITTTTTSSPVTIKSDSNGNDKKDKKWKGFTSLQSRQQKLIEQKKNLDDKSMIRKPISSYLSKFKKEDKKDDKGSMEKKEISPSLTTIATTTLKSTATTVPTTTLKSTTIEHQSTRLNESNKNRKLLLNNNKLEQNNLSNTTMSSGLTNNDRTSYSRTTSTTTTTTTLPSATNNHRSTNYNLNFENNNVNLTNSTINNQNKNSTTATDSPKPIRQRIFSAFNAGTRYQQRT